MSTFSSSMLLENTLRSIEFFNFYVYRYKENSNQSDAPLSMCSSASDSSTDDDVMDAIRSMSYHGKPCNS